MIKLACGHCLRRCTRCLVTVRLEQLMCLQNGLHVPASAEFDAAGPVLPSNQACFRFNTVTCTPRELSARQASRFSLFVCAHPVFISLGVSLSRGSVGQGQGPSPASHAARGCSCAALWLPAGPSELTSRVSNGLAPTARFQRWKGALCK